MSLSFHGPWTAWAMLLSGGVLAMLGIVMIAVGISDVRDTLAEIRALADAKRANDAINDGSDCFHGSAE